MIQNIKVYKITDRLYRVVNFKMKTNKDIWIEFGKPKYPTNNYNILTPTEQQAVEMELF